MKILFLGSPLFSKIVLERLILSSHEVVGVVTQPDRPSGRGHKLLPTEIKKFAVERGLPVYQFEKISQNMDAIREIEYDYALTASFGQILPQAFLDYRPCLNVHPSMLPKYRGATPIQTALLNGDTSTGVTIMRTVKAMDAGDIAMQEEAEIYPDDNYETLMVRLAKQGAEMAVKVFDLVESGRAKFIPQDDEKATCVKMISKEDGYLDFNQTAETLVNRVRALASNPGCYFYLGEDKIKVGSAKAAEFALKPFEIAKIKKRFVIGCADGAFEILSCQAPGGKMLRAIDFLNGYSLEGSEVVRA